MQRSSERSGEKCVRNSPEDTKVREAGGAPDTRAEVPPLQLLEETTVEQTPTLRPVEDQAYPEGLQLELGKSVWRKEQQRGTTVDWPQSPLLLRVGCQEPGKEKEGGDLIFVFSVTPTYLNWQ